MKHSRHAVVLCYNLTGNKANQIKAAAVRLGLQIRTVAPESFSLPLGHLLGWEEYAQAQATNDTPFTEEMLVFYQLSQAQLDAFLPEIRRAGGVRLKAVVTPTNVSWNSCALVRELDAEHNAIAQQRQAQH